MSARIAAGIMGLVLLFPVSASAYGFRASSPRVYVYYCPVTWVSPYGGYYYAPAAAPRVYYFPQGTGSYRPYAVPKAAPPSDTQTTSVPWVPSTKEPPRITE